MPRKKKSAAAKHVPAPAKPAARAKKTSPVTMTKAQFVRSQPPTATAKEVVAKARAAGITVTTQYVYNVRAGSKVRRRAAARAGKAAAARNGAPARAAGNRSAEDVLRALGAELGLARAIAVLEDERRSVRRLIGA